jgi:hypothetical protein
MKQKKKGIASFFGTAPMPVKEKQASKSKASMMITMATKKEPQPRSLTQENSLQLAAIWNLFLLRRRQKAHMWQRILLMMTWQEAHMWQEVRKIFNMEVS